MVEVVQEEGGAVYTNIVLTTERVPIYVLSKRKCPLLNVDMVDGKHAEEIVREEALKQAAIITARTRRISWLFGR